MESFSGGVSIEAGVGAAAGRGRMSVSNRMSGRIGAGWVNASAVFDEVSREADAWMAAVTGLSCFSSAPAGIAQLRPIRMAASCPFFTFLNTAMRDIPIRAAASGTEKKSLLVAI
jgi:hypothetical protein